MVGIPVILLLIGLLSLIICLCKRSTKCVKCKACSLKIFEKVKAKLMFTTPMRAVIVSFLAMAITADSSQLFFGANENESLVKEVQTEEGK